MMEDAHSERALVYHLKSQMARQLADEILEKFAVEIVEREEFSRNETTFTLDLVISPTH
jgi:hypothetical protein